VSSEVWFQVPLEEASIRDREGYVSMGVWQRVWFQVPLGEASIGDREGCMSMGVWFQVPRKPPERAMRFWGCGGYKVRF